MQSLLYSLAFLLCTENRNLQNRQILICRTDNIFSSSFSIQHLPSKINLSVYSTEVIPQYTTFSSLYTVVHPQWKHRITSYRNYKNHCVHTQKSTYLPPADHRLAKWIIIIKRMAHLPPFQLFLTLLFYLIPYL